MSITHWLYAGAFFRLGQHRINWRRAFSQRLCAGKRQFFAGILRVWQEKITNFRRKRSAVGCRSICGGAASGKELFQTKMKILPNKPHLLMHIICEFHKYTENLISLSREDIQVNCARATPHKCVCGFWRIFSARNSFGKPWNTQSIPAVFHLFLTKNLSPDSLADLCGIALHFAECGFYIAILQYLWYSLG